MPIARKPKAPAAAPAPQVDVEALIAKGGSVGQKAEEPTELQSGTTDFTMRVPKPLAKRIEDSQKKAPYKVNRHQWVLEAIVQRLDREDSAR